MAILKATECKDKHGRTLKVGDEIFVRGKVIGLPMDLESRGKAIVKVRWHGAIPLSDLVESTELEKSEIGAPKSDEKTSKKRKKKSARRKVTDPADNAGLARRL